MTSCATAWKPAACEVTTVAVRRERLIDKEGRNILDFLDLKKLTILPNTAGCFTAEDAVRHARLARELLANLGNPGADWVKLECLGDPQDAPARSGRHAQGDRAAREGRLPGARLHERRSRSWPGVSRKPAPPASCPPAAPSARGQGVLNPNNIRIILEYLKDGDPDYPVIVDAGVGTASDVAIAMELGCDGVLLNTGIAHAQDPLRMAHAMRHACEAGRLAYLAGRIPKKLYAQASSPMEGRIAASGKSG